GQHDEDGSARAAAHDCARRLEVDDELGEPSGFAARATGADRGRELDAEDLDQLAGDGVAVERVHHPPPLAPKRSVRIRAGSCPSRTSSLATASTKPVGPQM